MTQEDEQYNLADLSNGYLLQPYFHGEIFLETDKAGAEFTKKIKTSAYDVLKKSYPHIFIGTYFCERVEQLEDIRAQLYAIRAEVEYPSVLILDVIPALWLTNDQATRLNASRWISDVLLDLHDSYTSPDMDSYRRAMAKARFLDRVVTGQQSVLIREALEVSERQRPLMVARYGTGVKCPPKWRDPMTGKIRDEFQLDHRPLEKAIQAFAPWAVSEEVAA